MARELDYLYKNGGIGTHNWLLSHALADAGWDTDILYFGPVEDRAGLELVRDECRRRGIRFHLTSDFAHDDRSDVRSIMGNPWFLDESERVYRSLLQLVTQRRFDLIEFAECGAGAFRVLQAKQCGAAFLDTRIAVRLHSSSHWIRHANREWMTSKDDLKVDYCEQYSFERADIQLSPCHYMFDYVRSVGWDVKSDARVITYAFPHPGVQMAPASSSGDPEFVFFGRLEPRKGLFLFLDVLEAMPEIGKVSFLGRDTRLESGEHAVDVIRRRMKDRPYELHTRFNREQAHAFLRESNRIAVMPSLVDNYPFTVIEAAVEGFPFLASRAGGTSEILPDESLTQNILFEPSVDGLRTALRGYLDADSERRLGWSQRAQKVTDVGRNRRFVQEEYLRLLESPLPSAEPQTQGPSTMTSSRSGPLTTVGIPFYNGDVKHLEEAIRSIEGQSAADAIELLVLDDGSADRYRGELELLSTRHPRARFIRHEDNCGLGAARNRLLEEAQGEFFLPLDADNVARPRLVEHLAHALVQRPSLSALSCYFLAAHNDPSSGDWAYCFRPTGGPLVLSGVENVYSDATALFRTSALRSLGGYTTDRDTTFEDWEVMVRLVLAGHEVDVYPEYLYHYRHHERSLSRTTSEYLNHQRVLRHLRAAELEPHQQRALWDAFVGLAFREVRTSSPLVWRATDAVQRIEQRLRSNPKRWEMLRRSAKRAARVRRTAVERLRR